VLFRVVACNVYEPAVLYCTVSCINAARAPAGAAFAKEGMGRIAVLGSVQVFDDKWIDKEENSKLLDFVFKFLRPVSAGGGCCSVCGGNQAEAGGGLSPTCCNTRVHGTFSRPPCTMCCSTTCLVPVRMPGGCTSAQALGQP
jgi:hypothetical protein